VYMFVSWQVETRCWPGAIFEKWRHHCCRRRNSESQERRNIGTGMLCLASGMKLMILEYRNGSGI